MTHPAYTSAVTTLMQRITLEYQAAQSGLSGLAQGTARHAFMTAKQERIGLHHQELLQLVGPQEAIRLVAEALENA